MSTPAGAPVTVPARDSARAAAHCPAAGPVRPRAARPALALTVALLLAACGGGGGGGGQDAGAGAAAPPPAAAEGPVPAVTPAPPVTATGPSPAAPTAPALPVALPGTTGWKRSTLKLFVGETANHDLALSSPAFATLDPASTTWGTQLAPAPAGLSVTSGRVLAGAVARPATVQATITGTDATGRSVSQTVTVAVIARQTLTPPSLGSHDYQSMTLPAWYTSPTYPGTPGVPTLAQADTVRASAPPTNAGVALGRALFYDTRLSSSQTVSCATCHVQSLGFADPVPLSTGAAGLLTPRNSMGLTNVRYFPNGQMFWDLHARSLELQALFPIQSQTEMDLQLDVLLTRLKATGFYEPLFTSAFGPSTTPGASPIDANRIGQALAQFQRMIVSHDTKYDLALAGGPSRQATPDFAGTFTQQEMRGRALFEPVGADELARAGLPPIESMGCSSCHGTPGQIDTVGPQNVGLVLGPNDTGATGAGDFKVPSLRNVAMTAPYMHDGRFDTLEDVVRFFATGVQDTPSTSRWLRDGNVATGAVRRRPLSDDDVAALVAFLKTLTDPVLLTDPALSDPFTP